MSNPNLFLIKNYKEELSNFKNNNVKSTQSLEGISSISQNSQDNKKEDNSEEGSSRTPSSSSTEKIKEKEEEEELEDGFRTPTSLEHKISVMTCPPAPKKIKKYLKRRSSEGTCNCRQQLDLSKEVELLFPQTTQHIPLSDHSHSAKKIRRYQEPK